MAIYDRVCIRCGVTFKGGPRAWYCPTCRKDRERERRAKQYRNPPRRKIGSKDLCENCGAEYTVASGLQKYCPDCAPIMAKLKDTELSLAYYYRHKHIINPKRNLARRSIGKRCPVCGKDFYSPTVALYCSAECRHESYKTKARLIYDARRYADRRAKKKENKDD